MASTSGVTEEESCSSSPSSVYQHRRRRRGSAREYTYNEEAEILSLPKQENQATEEVSGFILKPAGWIIKLLTLQVKTILHISAVISHILNLCWSAVAEPVHRTVQAKDRATEVVSQNIAMISKVPPKVTEGGGLVLRKLGFGCMAATYVCIMLVLLLFFSLLLGIAFVSVWIEEPAIIRKPLYFDYTQSNPSAIVPLIPSNREKVPGRRIIPAGHKFSAVVTFVMPQSDHNRHVGMFQVMAELISSDDKVLARSSQPCMLPFRSGPIQLAKTFLMSLPLLMGIFGETETLVIHLIDYQEKNIPTETVKIILQPKALTSGLPELYSAEIDIRSQLPWIKEFSRKWKWTFCVWYTLAFYIFLLSLTICFCKQVLLLKSTTDKRDNKKPNKDEQGLHNVMTDNRMLEPGRRHSHNKNKHAAFVRESPPISLQHSTMASTERSLQHSTMASTERLGEREDRSEIVEESISD